MKNQSDREADRRVLLRLLKGLECYRAWRISCLERDKGVITKDDLDQIVMPGSFFLEMFDKTKGRAGAAVIKEVRMWYAHAASDLLHWMCSGDEALAADAQQFFKSFQEMVGFDFLAEGDLLRKIADKALKSGKISGHDAYYALKEIENDLSKSILTPEEMAKISDLLRAIEGERQDQ